jgi:hypothetical protein
MRLAPRFTITGLMTVVLVTSLSLAAMRYASAMWAGGLYLVTHGILVLAVVGAVCRGPSERAWWLGFALFGLVYLRGDFWFGRGQPWQPTNVLLDALRPQIVQSETEPFGGMSYNRYEYYWVVVRCLRSLVVATVGGLIAHVLFSVPTSRPAASDERDRQTRPLRTAWRRMVALGLAGLAGCTGLVIAGTRSDPALWVGAAYLLTWAVLGMAALGFACGQGRRRMVCLGAASFGLGYMVLNRGPDRFEESSYAHLVADQFLDSLRPWLPPVLSGFPARTPAVAVENARIKKVLDQPARTKMPDPATLEELLEYVRTAMQTADGRQTLIYVDPIGLQEAEKTLESEVQIDLDGRPVGTNLRLALRQLGMLYYVSDGQVNVTADGNEDIPIVVDYYLLLGHCFLALLAAGLGALVVPLVSARAADPPSSGQPGTAT